MFLPYSILNTDFVYDFVSLTQVAFLSMVSRWAHLLALSSFRVTRLTIRAVASLLAAIAKETVITFYTGA